MHLPLGAFHFAVAFGSFLYVSHRRPKSGMLVTKIRAFGSPPVSVCSAVATSARNSAAGVMPPSAQTSFVPIMIVT